MERKLAVGLVCLELQDGGFCREDAALEQIDRGENFVISLRTQHEVMVMLP